MNQSKQKTVILYIDSRTENFPLFENLLKYDHDFQHCESVDCVETAVALRPDIILMEFTEESERGAQEAGRQIREQLDHDCTSLVYLSKLSDNETRFRCYDAGADDFIRAPFDVLFLKSRLDQLIKAKSMHHEMKVRETEAQKLVYSSITSIAEQGMLLHFMRDAVISEDFETLAHSLLTGLSSLGLNASLALWQDETQCYYNSEDRVLPIEKDILKVAREHYQTKVTSIRGKRCIAQGARCTLLVHNMPDDAEKMGRYKDLMAMAVDNIDPISDQIYRFKRLADGEMQITTAVVNSAQAIEQLNLNTAQSRRRIKSATEALIAGMEEKFMTLGLTEEQEQALIELVLQAEARIDHEVSERLNMEEETRELLKEIKEMRWNLSKL